MGHRPSGSVGRHDIGSGRRIGRYEHTLNNEVVQWGDALWGDASLKANVSQFGEVEGVEVDESLFWKKGRWNTKHWCMLVVGVSCWIVPGRYR